MSAPVISTKEIAVHLNARMGALAYHLLGQPNKSLSTSQQLRYGKKGSVAIEIDGRKKGTWFNHESGFGGDALTLIEKQCGLHNGAAIDWAKEWLGLSEMSQKSKPLTQEEKRAARVNSIVMECTDIQNTPAQKYLNKRGITIMPPACIRFRPNACRDGYGAMVALVTDLNGEILAVQQTYLTNDGDKAPVKVVKRTNKATDGWVKKGMICFSGKEPIILAEGVETALSLWQATGQEVRACLGISNIASAPLPEKSKIIVACDGDELNSKADHQIKRAIKTLINLGHSVAVAKPPQGQDFNDLLQRERGEDAVRALIDGANLTTHQSDTFNARSVYIGSDVELAHCVHSDLFAQYGQIVHTDGKFWKYGKTHWEEIQEHHLRLVAHAYDGASYGASENEVVGVVKLSKSRIDSLLHELSVITRQPNFFAEAPAGINCTSGFIWFSKTDAKAQQAPHNSEHRSRHTLPGSWRENSWGVPTLGTMLHQLLDGSFKNDPDKEDKKNLLAEIFASAALGHATKLRQPKALVAMGEGAENGKSACLDVVRGMLPSSAICSLSAARMSDERHIVGLAGKLLNACDELSSSAAVSSDTFKSIITGEPVDGRDVYKSRVEFRPIAQHIFATNILPPFQGGMDRGVQRRLMVLNFNRTIPVVERVENIGQRIATEEADLLLSWVVDGATRLLRQRGFTLPASSKLALIDWLLGADPVLAWLSECVDVRPEDLSLHPIPTRRAYESFYNWAVGEGFKNNKLPAINGFVQRIHANATGITSKRTSSGRVFIGLRLKTMTQL